MEVAVGRKQLVPKRQVHLDMTLLDQVDLDAQEPRETPFPKRNEVVEFQLHEQRRRGGLCPSRPLRPGSKTRDEVIMARAKRVPDFVTVCRRARRRTSRPR